MRPILAVAALSLLPPAAAQVSVMDPVVATATRDPEHESDLPYSVVVLGEGSFVDSPSHTADDALRAYAGFSLFRRNDSMTANPTTQGVSLRGLGPSGTSRSLVLLDGVPLNDPFGGWVPWSLVPVDSLEGAEVVPGGGASAWGNASLAGVIQLFSAAPQAGDGDAAARAGGFGTRSADLSQAVAAGPGVLSVRAEDFSTDGAVLVAPAERGTVDIAAASRHNLEEASWRGGLPGGTSLVATVRRFDEWRDNGTAYQQNSFRQLFGSLAFSGKIDADAVWSLTGYAVAQSTSQTFSSVNAARSAETPASDQFAVPATAVGAAGSATWKDASGTATTVGADIRAVAGETREDYSYAAGSYADQRFAGGRQLFVGAFAEQSRVLAPGLRASAGVRLDRWENTDGHLRNVAASSGALLQQNLFPARAGTEFSPSAGLNWKAAGSLEFHLTAQRAFREPTLNELYRPFRQGTTTTLANAALETEHADSAELGAAWRTGHLTVTSAVFAARLENPVSNVTLAQGPGTFPLFGALPAGGVGQERLNLGRVDTQGFEAGAHWLAGGGLSLDASVVDEEAQVASAPVSPALVGRAVPEVPRWSATLGTTWSWRRLSASARVRWTGSQFDDDQNQLPLAYAAVVDVAARCRASSHAELFATVDNLGNVQVETAHSALGVFSIAPSRMAEVGARLTW